jgi:acetyl esterase/lipase
MRLIIATLLLTSAASAAELKIHRDLPYAEPQQARQSLDVYAPADGQNHPVIFWIHGGGWRRGDKANMQHKPQAMVERGYLFVATNYRFAPGVTVKQMTADIAKAIAWTHRHAMEYGGDPNRIVVMGHSAGAHLAALVSTDDRYLKAEGVPLSVIKGCVPVDVSVYDIAKRLEDQGSTPPETFKTVFGENPEVYRDLSPVTHVADGKHIPPFLILHVADRPETKAQSHWFADKLRAAGVPATVVAGEGKTHGTINSELGLADDKPTQALWKFLDEVLGKDH